MWQVLGEGRKGACGVLIGKHEEKTLLERLDVDRNTILRYILK
jgi:hypothetical protein